MLPVGDARVTNNEDVVWRYAGNRTSDTFETHTQGLVQRLIAVTVKRTIDILTFGSIMYLTPLLTLLTSYQLAVSYIIARAHHVGARRVRVHPYAYTA